MHKNIFLKVYCILLQFWLLSAEVYHRGVYNNLSCNSIITDRFLSGKFPSDSNKCKNSEPIMDAVADTEYGQLVGMRVPSAPNEFARIFLGVPFASPPIGALRFEKPIPPQKWYGNRKARRFASACTPIGRSVARLHDTKHTYNEDCLYLNVFAPWNMTSQYGNYPVVVFIHGGAFELGNAYDFGYKFFVENYVSRKIVVVTIQYRLAQFGFASSGDESFAGNYGLWDQRAALLYVQNNIASFGGDPHRITVWGHSAGSAIAGHLTLSNWTRDLFHSAIQMGAGCFGEWALNERVVDETRALSRMLHCPDNDSSSMKACLKEKSTNELLDAAEQIGISRKGINFIKFSPRLDYDFFGDDLPALVVQAPKKPTIIGISDTEALLFTLFGVIRQVHDFYISPKNIKNFTAENFLNFVREAVANTHIFKLKASNVLRKISEFYLNNFALHNPSGWNEENKYNSAGYVHYLRQYTKVISDLIFVVPILLESQAKMAANWPVYLYRLSYVNPDTFPAHIPIKSATHGTEYMHIFGIQLLKTTGRFNKNDLRLRENLIGMIETFVKTKKPSLNFLTQKNLTWPPLSKAQPFRHVNFDDQMMLLETTPFFTETLKFWKQIRKDAHGYSPIREVEKPAKMHGEDL